MKKLINKNLKMVYTALNIAGINVHKLLSLRFIGKYLSQIFKFKKFGGKIDRYQMVLTDFTDSAGSASGHYFHQDLIVAQYVYKADPRRHIDFGSRIDGFVAHIASFREIEILDIRSLETQQYTNIKFIQCDLMSEVTLPKADSVSCLHTLEHLGLGRYGDPLDLDGHEKGLRNLINLVEKNGKLYLSVPLSDSFRVHFNAHRVFRVSTILNYDFVKENLILENFDYVDDKGQLYINASANQVPQDLDYGLGIFTFRKL